MSELSSTQLRLLKFGAKESTKALQKRRGPVGESVPRLLEDDCSVDEANVDGWR